jgi:SRSO17 transposase
LANYLARFAPFFARREQRGWAEVYRRGLLTADIPRKNTEAMALRMLGAGEGADRRVRALQQFIGEADGVLIVDESAVPKRGEHSAGVARQWCGARGKQEHCQTPEYGIGLSRSERRLS